MSQIEITSVRCSAGIQNRNNLMFSILLSYFYLLVISLILTATGVSGGNILTNLPFSGVFIPNTTESAADFSASWLVHKSHLIKIEDRINASFNMAGATFAVTRAKYEGTVTVMTRDFFDFMVEHLSATSNQIPFSNPDIFEAAHEKLAITVKALASHVATFNETFNDRVDPRVYKTVAIMVYSSLAFSARHSTVQSRIRKPFFEATFWSVYRYFPNTIVFVADDKDAAAVRDMNIPYWRLVKMPVPLDHLNRSTALPRYSIVSVIKHMRQGTDYHGMEYVYFTEGDQILHMRRTGDLFDTIDNSDGYFVVAPHRMQTLPLMQDYPEDLHKHYKDTNLDIPSVIVIEEDLFRSHGSCCDDGFYRVAPCKGWWYQCREWGVMDMIPWFKFGSTGYTMPPTTEHRRSCSFSSEVRLCPLPSNCHGRKPLRWTNGKRAEKHEVCNAFSVVKYLGPPIYMGENATISFNASMVRDLLYNQQRVKHLETEVKRLKKKLRTKCAL